MKTDKQTMVEFRFPVTEEVLKTAAVSIQKNANNETYYSLVFIAGAEDHKKAVQEARGYLNRLFKAASEVIVQDTETKTDSNTERLRTEEVIERRVYASEESV